MSAQDLALFENYLLLTKEEAIAKQIKGSDTYYYLTFLKLFNEQGFDLNKDQAKQLEDYKAFKTGFSRNITLRAQFLEYDHLTKESPTPESEHLRAQIIKKIGKELFNLNFDHQQPNRVVAPSSSQVEQVQRINTLNECLVGYDIYLQDAYTEMGFAKLLPPLYIHLDLKQLAQAPLQVIKQFMHNVGVEIVDFANVPYLYNELFNNKKYNNEFNQTHFRKLSLIQIEELYKLNPKFMENQLFVGEFYIKKFQYKLQNIKYTQLTAAEKIDIKGKLLAIYEWTKQLPPKFKSFNDQILFELLEMGLELNDLDFDLFIVYLRDPKTYHPNICEQFRNANGNQSRQYQSNWHEYHQLNVSRWHDDNSLVKLYLLKYFEIKDDYSIFLPYLEQHYIKKIQSTVKLHQGLELENVYYHFTIQELQNMNEVKQITLCSYNKLTFVQNEEVKLFVELKNIPSLNIKIFEFNCENYYLQKFAELDPQLVLDGLIATEEITFNYTQAPVVKFTKEFTFESITKAERGIFIVEFIGNGLSTRAIIKKGRLQLKDKVTAAGHAFYIFNENFELCSGARTGMWVDNKFYPVDAVRKEVLIPFGERDQTYQTIIVHESYAELTSIAIQSERYELKCAFIVSNEQLLMGAQAKVLIQPKLFINNTPASLKLLKDPQVQVTSINDADVPQTLPFDNLKLVDDEPLEIAFPVAAKIKTITIKLSAKISRIHPDGNKKESLLEQQHIIGFSNQEGKNIFCQQYLRYTDDQGYQLYLLGKNGEPKQGIDIILNLRIRNLNHQVIEEMRTDAEGKVNLGHLLNATQLTSTVRKVRDISADNQTWNLAQNSSQQYPGKITILLGETLVLPYTHYEVTNKQISLVKTLEQFHGAVIESVTNQVKLNDHHISFKPATPGSYILSIKETNETIYLNVVEGSKWNNTQIIRSKQQLIDEKGLQGKILITDVEKQYNEKTTKLTARVISDRNVQVVVIATQFVQQSNEIIKNQIKSLLQKESTDMINIQLGSCVYQSNKELSDEQKYVLNRKNQERYVGNTLEKPQILLQRQEIRDTSFQNEELGGGRQYNDLQCDRLQEQRGMAKRMVMASSDRSGQQLVQTFQDFLQHPAQLFNNVIIKNGLIELEIPGHFSTVTLFAFNSSNVVSYQAGMKKHNIQNRNLTHQSVLNTDKFYSIFRNTQLVKGGEKIQIQDLTSTEIKVVDALDKMFILLKELRKTEGHDSEQETGFAHWEFLVKWEKLGVPEKHKLYDEHQCDELNLFIHFRDPAYFETYVKQYIVNKIERSFIDHFLLQDEVYLLKQSNVESLHELNALEQTLLVIFFAEIANKKDIAQQIASYLENKNKLILVDQKRYKALFDTILGAQTNDQSVFPQSDLSRPPPPATGGLFGCVQPHMPAPMAAMAPRMMQQKMMCMNQAPMGRFMPQQMMQQQLDYLMDNQQCEMKLESDECYDDFDGYSPQEAYGGNQNAYYEGVREQTQVSNFKNIENTKEYGEKHYCKARSLADGKNLVTLNGFWVDLANHSLQKGVFTEDFLSNKFIYCNQNHTQMIAVLALIGLPNDQPEQEYKPFQGKGVEITTKSGSILFTKEIREGQAQLRPDILVAQRFFDPNDRFTYSDDDPELQLEKDVKECLVDKIYGCQVTITNCSSTKADYQVLIEVPNGAIPVNTVSYTKSITVTLNPYSTQRIEYFFYFPKEGEFNIYPANVSRFGTVVCVAKEQSLKVVIIKSVVDQEVLDDILAKGNQEEILNFVATRNIFNTNIFKISDILYLLKDKQFYVKLIEILRNRRFNDYTTWSYSVYHNDYNSLKEFFNYQSVIQILSQRFSYFKCSLFEVSRIRLIEYYPLISKRVHKLTQEAKGILNVQFRTQYQEYLAFLVEKGTHTLSDKLTFIYYLLLQERINEAVTVFKTITDVPAEGEAVLQYDYFSAYLDFYIGYPNFQRARQICEKYIKHPVIHWRNLFYEVVNQLSEFDGDDDSKEQVETELTQKKKNQQGANKEETLTIEVEGSNINITYANLSEVTIQYYKIDLEILFSSNPFLNNADQDYSYVIPNFKVTQKLESQPGLTQKNTIQIPPELKSSNLFIQVKGLDKRASARYYSTSLNIQVMENFGQIKVADSNGKNLSRVYVKTYILEKNGKELFYKDGYTDLRGRFDYASLSSTALANADKFSILVTSDELGSVIKEVKAPSQVGKLEQEVKLVSNAWNSKAYNCEQTQVETYQACKSKLAKKYK